MSKLRQSHQTLQVKEALAEVYSKLALDTYVTNLPFNFQQIVRTRDIQVLEEAINCVLKEEQFNQYKQTIQKHVTPPNKPSVSNNKQFATTFNRYPTQNTSQKFNWPNQPIPVQPKPVQSKFPTNKQVFGKPQNVWKPNQYPNNYSQTPMSGISHTQTNHRSFAPTQRFNHFQSQSRPTFQSTEINSTELDNTLTERSNTYSGIPYPVEETSYFTALHNLELERQQLDFQIEQLQQNIDTDNDLDPESNDLQTTEYSNDSFLEETEIANHPT